MRRWFRCAVVAAALGASACAEPPNKEIDQAQGGIDAARAAGADQYAPTEYQAAVNTLKQANEAVAQRDYRLALNYALESREHAQSAAREAADTRARVRGEVERAMAEIATLLAQANTRLNSPRDTGVPARARRTASVALAEVNTIVQKAGAAMKADNYLAAQPLLQGVKERIEKVIASLDVAAKVQTSRRRR